MLVVLGVVVTVGSTFSVDMLLLMNVVVWVFVVCEESVVSVDESTSSVDVVLCVMLRSTCSVDVVLFTVVRSACPADVLGCVVVRSACSADIT